MFLYLRLDKLFNMYTKKYLIALLCLPNLLWAQSIDYNTIILPAGAKEISFSEKLVQLAWGNNPENQVLRHQVNIAEYGEKVAKRNFLTQISATGNINEFNLDPPKTNNQPIFFPRYNFGATISLGNFFIDPVKVKRAKEETAIALQNVNSRKLALRAEVLKRYQIYLTNKELLKVQTDALEDASATFSLAEQKFKNGEATIVDFNAALDNLNVRKIQKITADGEFYISKIAIEELIGVKLEEVVN
jgi:outer membrane protein TolC